MPTSRRRSVLALALAWSLAACAGSASSPASMTDEPGVAIPTPPGGPETARPAPVTPSAAPSVSAPVLTPVPGGGSGEPVDPGQGTGSTTDTDWGRILDVVPEGFPVHPAAEPMEPFEGPASGTWLASDAVDPVAEWYASTFEDRGWATVELGGPLEDGTRILDLASDLPECQAQLTFRPADESTIISVLYGAGCAGGDG